MCNDKDYELEDFKFFVSKSDIIVNSEVGLVTLFDYKNLSTKVVTSHINETKPFKLNDKFVQKVDLSISRNDGVEIHVKYHTWSKTGLVFDINNVDHWIHVKSERYIENLKIQIHNELDKPIKFEIFTYEKQLLEKDSLILRDNGVVFSNKRHVHLKKKGILPGNFTKIYLHKPEV